jgi:hypothetical protein
MIKKVILVSIVFLVFKDHSFSQMSKKDSLISWSNRILYSMTLNFKGTPAYLDNRSVYEDFLVQRIIYMFFSEQWNSNFFKKRTSRDLYFCRAAPEFCRIFAESAKIPLFDGTLLVIWVSKSKAIFVITSKKGCREIPAKMLLETLIKNCLRRKKLSCCYFVLGIYY